MDKKYCKIGWDGVHLLLLDKDNQPISGQAGIEIINNVEEPAFAKLSLLVNLEELIDLREKPKKIKKSLFNRFINIFYNG